MSDNELRDRIAKALFDESYLDAPPETIPNEMHPGYHEMAQAIIDEFGLEVVSDGGRPEWKLQIVGKWEESDEQESRP